MQTVGQSRDQRLPKTGDPKAGLMGAYQLSNFVYWQGGVCLDVVWAWRVPEQEGTGYCYLALHFGRDRDRVMSFSYAMRVPGSHRRIDPPLPVPCEVCPSLQDVPRGKLLLGKDRGPFIAVNWLKVREPELDAEQALAFWEAEVKPRVYPEEFLRLMEVAGDPAQDALLVAQAAWPGSSIPPLLTFDQTAGLVARVWGHQTGVVRSEDLKDWVLSHPDFASMREVLANQWEMMQLAGQERP